jgi:hypothetical protein
MIVVTRHQVALEQQEQFLADARVAVALLAEKPGCLSVAIGRSVDEPDLILITSQWIDVGSYRHALGAFDVKVGAVPLLSTAIDEPSAYEVLHRNGPDGAIDFDSDFGGGEWALGRPTST